MPFSAMELMICCAARLLENGRTVAVGTGVPAGVVNVVRKGADAAEGEFPTPGLPPFAT